MDVEECSHDVTLLSEWSGGDNSMQREAVESTASSATSTKQPMKSMLTDRMKKDEEAHAHTGLIKAT